MLILFCRVYSSQVLSSPVSSGHIVSYPANQIRDFPSVSEAIRAGVRDMIERRCGKFGHKVLAGDCYE